MRTIICSVLFAGFCAGAQAGPPMKTTSCADRIHVRAPRNGSGVFFDDKCETAYVLPPVLGKIEMQGNQPTVSREDCTELAALGGARAQLAERLRRLTERRARDPGGGGSTIGRGGGLGGGQDESPSEADMEKIKKDSAEILAEINRLREAERVFTSTEGLVSKIIYTLDHEGLVGEYARLNPEIKGFVRLPLEKAYLTIAAKDEALKQSGSEVLDYQVPGLNKFSDEEGQPPENSVYFGTAMSGRVRLNQKAACQLLSKFGGRIPENLSATLLERHMSANITYAYGVNVRRQYYARYNFQKLFEHIAKQTQQGGFFSSKSINEVVERNESSSWFEFHSTSDDTRFPNEILVQQLKTEMIDRVMGQIAIATVPGSSTIPAHLTPGPKGADVAANALKKCPYVYCQVAGYVLDFLSATLGESQSVARFLSTVGSTSEERVNESKTLRFIGTSTFRDRI